MLLPALVSVALGQGGASVVHYVQVVQDARCDVVVANLKDPKLKVDIVTSAGGPGTDEDFATMVQRPGVIAAINGAYFDIYNKKPIGDLWANGQLLNRGSTGTALTVKADGAMDIFRVQRHKTMDWSGYETVFACGPALLLDGHMDCNCAVEGFTESIIFPPIKRTAVGYTQSGKIMFVYCSTNVAFDDMGSIMRSLGCYEALNLDAGSSLALWFRGNTIRKPGRRLTNILVIRQRT